MRSLSRLIIDPPEGFTSRSESSGPINRFYELPGIHERPGLARNEQFVRKQRELAEGGLIAGYTRHWRRERDGNPNADSVTCTLLEFDEAEQAARYVPWPSIGAAVGAVVAQGQVSRTQIHRSEIPGFNGVLDFVNGYWQGFGLLSHGRLACLIGAGSRAREVAELVGPLSAEQHSRLRASDYDFA